MILARKHMPSKPNPKTKSSINRAVALHNNGQVDQAIAIYKELLDLEPHNPDLWNLLGVAAHQQNNNSLAKTLVETAISLKKDAPDYYNNLGLIYRALNGSKEANQAFRKAIKINPKHSNALSNLASLLRYDEKYEESLSFSRQAIDCNPNNIDALNNLGNSLWDSGLYAEAIKTYRKAVKIQPTFALSHWNLALALLSMGEYEEGFQQMSWRWKWAKFPGKKRVFNKPRWHGEDISNKTILLHPEQGLGDTLQFMRYSTLVKKVAKRVILELPREIIPLAMYQGLANKIIQTGETPADFDLHSHLIDLPGIFGTTPNTVPQKIPYIKIKKDIIKKWVKYQKQFSGKKIGINWRGNLDNPVEKIRGIPLPHLSQLFQLPGVSWFNLQKGNEKSVEPLIDTTQLINTGPAPLEETAGLISTLDLIITSDTLIAHLAGALGKPVWILLHHSPDWRWMTTGKYSNWYPTASLFRQPRSGDWNSVVADVYQNISSSMQKNLI